MPSFLSLEASWQFMLPLRPCSGHRLAKVRPFIWNLTYANHHQYAIGDWKYPDKMAFEPEFFNFMFVSVLMNFHMSQHGKFELSGERNVLVYVVGGRTFKVSILASLP